MSIQAVMRVEIGAGIAAATSYGSEVMDEIGYNPTSAEFTRAHQSAPPAAASRAASPTAKTWWCAGT